MIITIKRMDVNIGSSRKYRINYTYDDFSRYENKVVEFGNIDNTTTYSYLSSSNATTALISQYTTNVTNDTSTLSSQTFKYTYDEANQNITEIKDAYGNVLYRYTYDSLDRLIREDNSVTNKTYLYTYDDNGNIRDEIVFYYTLGDAYDSTFVESNLWTYTNSQWGDQLTNYNGGAITYDSMGNPLIYYNGLEFTWNNVNNLASLTDWDKNYTYTYNDNGIRTSKTINGVTHTYHLDGTRILSEEYGNKLILYIYDESGSIIGMAYRTSSYASGVFDYYLFTKNLQGDTIGIYDTNGNCVASYTYNAWGEHTVTNHTSANIGNINPFRYRGYYYDTETGFYYLNARYYDPQIKRFINADIQLSCGVSIAGLNLYSYCDNNPIMYVDNSGYMPIAIGIVLFVGMMVGCTVTLRSDTRQEPTQEQIEQAILAAEQAELEESKDNYGNDTIKIHIDTQHAIDNVDVLAYDHYYERLYERTLELAEFNGIKTEYLMDIKHIRWEYQWHAFAHSFGFDSAKTTDLDIDETRWTMIKKGWRAIWND